MTLMTVKYQPRGEPDEPQAGWQTRHPPRGPNSAVITVIASSEVVEIGASNRRSRRTRKPGDFQEAKLSQRHIPSPSVISPISNFEPASVGVESGRGVLNGAGAWRGSQGKIKDLTHAAE